MGCIIESYPNSKLWAKLLEIEAEVESIIHERLSCTQNSPSLVGTGETIRFSVSIIDSDTGPIAEDKIVAGTYDLIRIRNNVETTIVDDGAFSKRDGFIYIDIDFDTATWDLEDSYILIPNQNSTAEIDGTTYHLPLSAWSGMILDLSGLETAINAIITTLGTPAGASISADIADIEAKLDNGTFGLAALDADLDALLADVGNASGSGLGSLYGILGDPAQTFTTMVGYEGATSLADKLTLARAEYLDELAAANLPTDVQNVYNDSLHSLKFTGTSWFVDGDSGNDANSGITPDLAFQHIANAITAAGIGDRIYVMAAAAAYDENNLDLNDIGLELYCEKGTVLSNSAGGATTTITLSANYTRISGATLIQAGVSGVNVTGSVCLLDNCLAANCAVGFDIDGFANTIRDCKSNNHATTGFDIYDDSNTFENCIAIGDGSARGFYLSHANAGNNTFLHCQTANNGTGAGEAGYEVVASADNNIFSFCSMSDGDRKVDAGTNNTWSDFSEGSQIVAGQTRDQDLKNIYDDVQYQSRTAVTGAGIANSIVDKLDLGVGYKPASDQYYTLTRGGYLDNINNANLSSIPDISTLSAARIGYLDNINQVGLLQVTAARAGFLDNIDNANLSTIPDISTLSAARIGYLDELAAANLPADIDDILAEKLEVNEVIIYPTAEDSSTTALSDDGTSPAYLTAATHTGDTNWTDAWTEDINFEQAGTISVISIYAEVGFEMKTSDAGATATARLQISGDGGGSWVTVTDELTTTSIAYIEKLRAGTGTWITAITSGANQLQFKLQHKISDGTKTVSTAMRTSTYFRITYCKS